MDRESLPENAEEKERDKDSIVDVTSAFFDQMFGNEKEEQRTSEVERITVKKSEKMTALIVAERMTRATRLQSLRKKTFTGRATMLDRTAKRKDFDFLGLRKEGAQYTN